MAFVPAFTVTPNPLDNTSFQIVDNSTGDPNITDRQISLYLASGGLLGPVIDWPISAPSPFPITGLLTTDQSLQIGVVWTSSAPISGSVYTLTQLFTFTANTQAAIYAQIQALAAKQTLLNDDDFSQNLSLLEMYLDSAIQAQNNGSQGNAQNMLNFAQNIIQNAQLYL